MARSSSYHVRHPPNGTGLLIARSKTCCHANGKLLAQSRLLIARARRLLNPAWTISGSSDEVPVPREVWAGHETGHVCIVCGRPISSVEIENEIVGPRAHLACYSIWWQESDLLERSRQSRAPDYLADLCQIVRARLAAGSLFVLPDSKSWAGRGISDICAVCSKPIFAAEVSQELIGARRDHAHLMCYRAWRMESVTFSESGGRPRAVSG